MPATHIWQTSFQMNGYVNQYLGLEWILAAARSSEPPLPDCFHRLCVNIFSPGLHNRWVLNASLSMVNASRVVALFGPFVPQLAGGDAGTWCTTFGSLQGGFCGDSCFVVSPASVLGA